MKCYSCSSKAEMILQSQRTKKKVGYCRLHWLALCMQETFKHLKLNNINKEKLNEMYDAMDTYVIKGLKEFTFEDIFKSL